MAANASYKSRWIETYKDKSLSWLEMRLEYYRLQELSSVKGSPKRRAEIKDLRLTIQERKAAAPAVVSPVSVVPAGYRPAGVRIAAAA